MPAQHHTRLSVNINKIALLRNARGGDNPNVLKAARDCESFGAQGITVHPRPDERHIRYRDVIELRQVVATELNVEGFPDGRFMNLVLNVKPDQVTLVPDPPGVLTSNTGWNTRDDKDFLKDTIAQMKEAGIRVSVFLNPDPKMVESAAETGADRIELYTEPYASAWKTDQQASAIQPYIKTAQLAQQAGLGVNAGHDLDLKNLRYLVQNIPGLMEVSIGHALICDALYLGLENTIGLYLRELRT